MRPTIRDIAAKAQVSVSTVSRVLNGKPDVRSETQKQILDVIEELGFSPSSVARGLVLKRSNVIGFVVPDITNPSFPELARGIVAQAKTYGFSVMFSDTNHDNKVEKDVVRLMRSKQVDGIILSFDLANKDELERLKSERVPVVQIYRKSAKSTISTIAIDNESSGYKAASYLAGLGHRRIAHISTGMQTQSGHERWTGYQAALRDAGIEFDEDLVVVSDNNAAAGSSAMKKLLNLPVPPTAVFACHDMMAIGAYEAIREAGLEIPKDISVVGHDNLEISRLVWPRLTTIDTHKGQLGRAGVDLLMEEIKAGKALNKEVVFSTDLIIRDSAMALEPAEVVL
ncbi:MAG: LacI family DNA-binding transcriptional regulator [Spirochaetaceae bacterium]|nr:LacI family DNA-binding transcriptional regulator [Spirochaetaceae bacterium]MDT8297903.1 LacI family DNA-binding transcriptional regulator [Spirochaetaceae bacterium]